MNIQTDPHTEEVFVAPRSNQKFANRDNQVAYNNELAKDRRDYLNKIDAIIHRNWEILLRLLGDHITTNKSKEYLKGCGYDFMFFNHLREIEGHYYFASYDVGIREIAHNNYKIINLMSYE
jgi:hypothetical protein